MPPGNVVNASVAGASGLVFLLVASAQHRLGFVIEPRLLVVALSGSFGKSLGGWEPVSSTRGYHFPSSP